VSARSAAEWRRTNERLIAEFRSSGGHPKRRKWPLLLLTTVGVRSGKPLYYTTDGDRFVVVASYGGAAVEQKRSRLFPHHAELMPFYEGFRKRMKKRELPVVVLERRG
jgi:hypothetical protein